MLHKEIKSIDVYLRAGKLRKQSGRIVETNTTIYRTTMLVIRGKGEVNSWLFLMTMHMQ